MSKAEREETLSALASRIFSAMLDELIMDTTLAAHCEVARSRAVCNICNTHCGMIHASSSSHAQPSQMLTLSIARPSSPSEESSPLLQDTGQGAGTNTPMGTKNDGITLFECVNCKRQIASNRYAPHLSSCMGIGTGTRRAAPRNGNGKTKISAEPGRSASPYLGSDNGLVSDESKTATKGKGKARSKQNGGDSKRKRADEILNSPQKKQNTSASPVSRIRADRDVSSTPSATHFAPPVSSQSKIPSRLRSSTASLLEKTLESDPDRSSSPSSHSSAGTPIASISTPTSSALSAHSPAGTGPPRRGRKPGSRGMMMRGGIVPPPARRPSPPRPLPPPVVRVQPDYLMGDQGEETGSSTDTDSS